MVRVEMYTSNNCPYCVRAKALLKNKGVCITELNVDQHPELVAESIRRSNGRKTVPQIFIENFHIGGYDELSILDQKDELDILLQIKK